MGDKHFIAYDLCKKEYKVNTIGDKLKKKFKFIPYVTSLLNLISQEDVENILNKPYSEELYNKLFNDDRNK